MKITLFLYSYLFYLKGLYIIFVLKVWEKTYLPLSNFIIFIANPILIVGYHYINYVYCAVLSCLICVQLFATLWTIACQFSLSMGFFRQEYWSALAFPPPGDLPNSKIDPASLLSPALVGGFHTTNTTWEALLQETDLNTVSSRMASLPSCPSIPWQWLASVLPACAFNRMNVLYNILIRN